MSAKKRSSISGATKRKLQALREQDEVKSRKVIEKLLQKELQQHSPEEADSETMDSYVGSPSVMQESLDGGHAAIDSAAQPSLIEKDKKADKYEGAANISCQELTP